MDSRASLTARAAKGFLWAAISFGGNRLIVFASTLALAWILTPTQFGIVAAALTVVLLFEVALDLGLGSAVIYEQERGLTGRVQTAFTTNLGVAVVLAIAVAALAPWIAEFFGAPDQTLIFRSLGIFLLLRGLVQVPDAMLRRDLDFKARAAVELSRAVVRAGLAVGLAVNGFGAWAFIWGVLAGQFVGVVLTWVIVGFRPTFAFKRAIAAELLAFGLPVFGSRVVGAFLANSDYLVVGNRLGEEALATYQIAYRVPEVLIGAFLVIFARVAFPAFSQAREKGMEVLKQAMLRSYGLMSLYGFCIGLTLALAARDIIGLIVPSAYAGAALPMAFISLSGCALGLTFASGDIFPAVGKPGILLKINILQLIVLVGALIAAVPHGLAWVAFALLPVNIAYTIVRIVLADRLVGATFSESVRAMRPGWVAAAGLVVVGVPVWFFVGPGITSLVLLLLACAAGALAGLFVGSRSTFAEIYGLAKRAVA